MPINQVRVGAPSNTSGTDNVTYDQLGGKQGEAMVAQLHDKHYTSAYRGNVFIATTTPLGLAIPIYTSTTPTVMLWNPSGNTKNAVLIRFIGAYASGTTVGAAIGLSKVFNTGASIATANVISAFAATTPINALLNSGNTASVRVSTAGTNTITAGVAADFFYTMWQEYAALATSAITPTVTAHDFNGAVVVTPGTAVWPSGSVASGALISQTLIWEEVPV